MIYYGMDIKYIAGLFDGEGYVGVVHQRGANCYVLVCTITNTCPAIFPRLRELYPASVTSIKGRRAQSCYTWRVNGPHALRFLRDIAPHVIIKREQVDLALTFPVGLHGVKVTPEMHASRAEIYLKLKAMKRVQPTMEPTLVRRNLERDDLVLRAIALYSSGKSAMDVADELGVKSPTVFYWLRQTGVIREKGEAVRAGAVKRWEGYYDQPLIKEAAELYKSGLSAYRVAKRLKVKPATVNAWIRSLGLTRTLAEAAALRHKRGDS